VLQVHLFELRYTTYRQCITKVGGGESIH